MFLLMLLSFVLVISLNIVTADSYDYCTDSDAGRVVEEKAYTINTRPFEGETYTDIYTGEEFLFDSGLERGWNSMQVEEQKDGKFTITYTKSEGTVGKQNIFEKGEVYGKENILSEDYVTKEDFCVLLETITVSQSEISESHSEDYGEGSVWIHKDGKTSILRCLDGNCSSARVNECEGDNCGVMEYGCYHSRLGGLSRAKAIFYYLTHPIKFFKHYDTLFKDAWEEKQGFVSSSILRADIFDVQHCVDGRFVGIED